MLRELGAENSKELPEEMEREARRGNLAEDGNVPEEGAAEDQGRDGQPEKEVPE